MKKRDLIFAVSLITITLIIIYKFLVTKFFVFGQQNCVQIKKVSVDQDVIKIKKLFKCFVETDQISNTIACGISVNGSWPQNFCPSDQFFGGWRENIATFNCVIPNEILLNGKNDIELVGFDFRSNCGPSMEKRISLKYNPVSLSENNKEIPNSAEEMINSAIELLKIIFSLYPTTDTTDQFDIKYKNSTDSMGMESSGKVFSSIRKLFNEVGSQVGVPPAILEAVMLMESPSTFNLDSQQIRQYSLPGNVISGCRPNQCSATGPMQMTIGYDYNRSTSCSGCCWGGRCLTRCPNAWATFGEGNPCNLKDNIYAAARKLKNDSGAQSSSNWTKEQVFRAAERYYGDCTERFSGKNNMTYCEFVWWYYQNHE
jgi:hypothetical protein